MLQFTSRLRDRLCAGNFSDHYRKTNLNWLLEAEFILPEQREAGLGSIEYPATFDLRALQVYCHSMYPTIVLERVRNGNISPETRRSSAPGRRVGKGRQVNILWISQQEFVSPIEILAAMDREYRDLWNFSIRIVENTHNKSIAYTNLWVYSLATFEAFERPLQTTTPLHFLHHLLRTLPIDFFRCVEVVCSLPTIAPEQYSQLLAILPADSVPSNHNRDGTLTQFHLSGIYNSDQVQSIISHRYSPYVEVWFNKYEKYPQVNMSISAVELNAALRELKHVYHIGAPKCLSSSNEDDIQVSFATNAKFKSLSISICDPVGLPVALFNGVKENRQIQRLTISYHLNTPPCVTLMTSILETLFLSVLPGHASLTELRFKVSVWIKRDSLDDVLAGTTRFVDELISDLAQSKASHDRFGIGRLAFLSFSFSITVYDSVGHGIVYKPKVELEDGWDNFIAPSLHLNWFNNNQKQLWSRKRRHSDSNAGLTTLLVRAINNETIHSKTTSQVLYNPETAHASVLFALLSKKLSVYGASDASWAKRGCTG
jgi:hypothetical protein